MKRLTIPLLLIVFPGYVLSQIVASNSPTIARTEWSQRGVVVEEVTKNSAAEKAGLREGDVLLEWQRGVATGDIESPFDISWLEIEDAPLGPISLVGVRDTERRAWVLGSGAWGVHVKPNSSGLLLAAYNEVQQMARDGKAEEAAARWETMSHEIEPALARIWFLLRAAEARIGAKQLEKADGLCQEAFKNAPATVVRVGLLRSCAAAFQKIYERDKAAAYYQQALEASRKSCADDLSAAASLQDLAQLALRIGDFNKAEDYVRKALGIRERLAPDSLPVAGSFNMLALIEWKQGDFSTAEQYHQRALSIRQKLSPNSLDVADSFNGLAVLARDSGDLKKAEAYHLQALEIREKLAPGSLEMAQSLSNLGVLNWTRGDLAKAESYYRQALAIKEKLAPGSLEIVGTLSNLAVVIHERGDLIRAEEYHRRALGIREKLNPGSMEVADSLNNIGLLLLERDDFDGAEDYLQRALAIVERRAPGSAFVGRGLENIGSIALKREDFAKAETYCRRALLIHEKIDPGSLQNAIDLDCLGDVALGYKNLNLARQRYLDALAMREKVSPASVEIGSDLLSLASVADQTGDLDKAEEYARHAITIEEQLAPGTKDHAAAFATLAMIMRHKQQPDAALQLFDQALNSIEQQMAHLGGGGEIRSEFRAKEMNYYTEYLDLLVQMGKTDLAFQLLERSRFRGLLEMLGEAKANIRKGVSLESVEKERSLRELLAAKSSRRMEMQNDSQGTAQASGLDKEIQAILREYQEVEEKIRQTSPGYAALTQPQPLTAQEVQQRLLDKDTLLLEYALGQERSYVFAVTQDSIAVFPLPKLAEINASARELYRLLSVRGAKDKPKMKQAIATLSHQVLGPVAGQLNKKRVLVVSDGALQYIPFVVLLAPEDPSVSLLMEHEVVNLPSASVLAVLRRQLAGRKPAPRAVAVLADPVFDRYDDRLRLASKNNASSPPETAPVSWQSGLDRSARDVGMAGGGVFPRLLYSRREANAIYSTARHGDATKLLDFDASKDTAMNSRLQDYRIVHYATHGLLNSEHPELSGLVFSLVDRKGKPQDGFLRLIDIYNLELNADLVVLSACQTALGKQIAEEGLVGLTRGFMYAGAPRVVASLWKVDDEATAELMKKFYEGMLQNGQTPAQALRSSQLWMSQQKRWKEPYYWAGFIIQGEWK